MTASGSKPGSAVGYRTAPRQARLWRRASERVVWVDARLAGEPDPERLEAALRASVAAHAVLRTTLEDGGAGDPLQRIADEAPDPFGPAGGGPLAAAWVNPGDGSRLLRLRLAATSGDRESLRHLLADVARRYAGDPATPEPEPYLHYSEWLLEEIERGGAAARRYWEGLPAGEATFGWAPPGVTSDGAALSARASTRAVRLGDGKDGEGGEDGIGWLAREAGVSERDLLLTCWRALAFRWTGASDPVVGVRLDGRRFEELAGSLGPFEAEIPLAGRLRSGLEIVEIARRAASALREAGEWIDHAEAYAGPRPDLGFSYLDWSGAGRGDSLGSVPVAVGPPADPSPLHLDCRRLAGGLDCVIHHDTSRFPRVAVARLAASFAALVGTLVDAEAPRTVTIGAARVVPRAERHRVEVEWNDTGRSPVAGPLIHERLAEQARVRPDALALRCGERSLSFAACDRAVAALAGRLRAAGVGPEAPVGVWADRSIEAMVALLAVWRAGGVCVPFDPTHPAQRVVDVLRASKARLLVAPLDFPASTEIRFDGPVVDRSIAPGELVAGGAPAAVLSGVGPDHLAYVLYTSGSTGRPKGVAISHGALANHLEWGSWRFPVRAGRSAPIHTSMAFDLTMTGTLVPLAAGELLDLLPEGVAELSDALLRIAGASLIKLTPSHLRILDEELADRELAGLAQCLVIAGETLSSERIASWSRRDPGTALINEYGPTETTIGCTTYGIGPDRPDGRIPIGRPVDNTRVYVVDPELRPVPAGVAGQVLVGGAGLGRGYLGSPAATARAMIPDPFGDEPGGRLYATGDLGSWLEPGVLDFRSRVDHQVKIRGYRIDLGEVEGVLAEHPGVRAATVVHAEDLPGGPGLIAYVVAGDESGGEEAPVTPAILREALGRRLPDPMIPSLFTFLPALPLTAHGKVDRSALPKPSAAPAGGSSFRPRTPGEELLADLWSQTLGTPPESTASNLFEQGGHSLTILRLLARVRRGFGVEVAVDEIVKGPTFGALLARIEEGLASDDPPPPPIEPVTRDGTVPLSSEQRRIWFLERLAPEAAAYNVPSALELSGELSLPVLARSVEAVTRRHEVLRGRFGDADGRAVQWIAPPAPVPLPLADLSGVGEEARRRERDRLLRAEASRPFDLGVGPPLRLLALRLAPAEHAVACTLHHVAADGWSSGLLTREIAALYNAFQEGREPSLPALPVQYTDYAIWQRRWLEGGGAERHLAYWRERLGGSPALLDLPTDRPRSPVRGQRGGVSRFDLSRERTERLRKVAREAGATPFMILLAAFQVLLAHRAGRTEVAVGVPVAGRSRTELEGLIGVFVNTLVIRTAIPERTRFADLLREVRRGVLEAQAHQHLPFETLVEELHPARDLARPPLFEVMLSLDASPREVFELPGLRLARLPIHNRAAKFDLTLLLDDAGGPLGGLFEYDADLFDATTIERLGRHLEILLDAALEDPEWPLDALPWLGPAEWHQTVVEANDVPRPPGGGRPDPEGRRRPVHRSIARRFEGAADAVAIATGTGAWSYAKLGRRVRRLAAHLAARGVGPETRVAVLAERSPELVVAILAVLEAGGAFVPVDPSHPAERIRFTLEDSGSDLVLTDRDTLPAAPGIPVARIPTTSGEPSEERTDAPGDALPEAGPDGLAYVLYTSGSTGRPKGALISHGSLSAYLAWAVAAYQLEEGGGAVLHSSVAFDLSLTSLFAPLVRGGTLSLAAPGEGIDPLLDALSPRVRPGLIKLTPTHLRALDALPAGAALAAAARPLVVGGEALAADDLAPWWARRADLRVFNEYGPTEATVACAAQEADRSPGPVPIGRPIPGARLHVTNPALDPVPLGVPGELVIGGDGLARGYLGRPALTAERFVPDPVAERPGGRLYRTGDEALRTPGGSLRYRGRIDHQIKVRGHRVEPEEVERALAESPAVERAAVALRGSGLAAWIVPSAPGGTVAVDALRELLAARLPAALIPTRFVEVEALPLAASGKIDRKALPDLPDPSGTRPASAAYAPPTTPAEETLAEIWTEVLQLDRVGIHDNFFEIGGDSILSIQIVARAGQRGLRLTPRQVFQHQTVAGLARVVGTAEEVVIDQGPVSGAAPLTPIQRWFFERDLATPDRYDQALVLDAGPGIEASHARAALDVVVRHHDALRLRFHRHGDGWRQRYADAPDPPPMIRVDLAALPSGERRRALATAYAGLRDRLDLASGPLLAAAWIDRGADEAPLLMVVIHHLVVDGVSWRILVEDLGAACAGLARGEAVALPRKTTSYRAWAERLVEHAGSEALDEGRAYWRGGPAEPGTGLPAEAGGEGCRGGGRLQGRLDPETTERLLREVPRAYGTRVDEALLAALAIAWRRRAGAGPVRVDVESHGRQELWPDVDLSRTVGWFTTFHPLVVELDDPDDVGAALVAVKERLRRMPHGGLDYGVLRFLAPAGGDAWPDTGPDTWPASEAVFNYLGRIDAGVSSEAALRRSRETPEGDAAGPPAAPLGYALAINGGEVDGALETAWVFDRSRLGRDVVAGLMDDFFEALRAIVAHCATPGVGESTPSDFRRVALEQVDLDAIASELELD